MDTIPAVIDSLNAKIKQMQTDLDAALKRAATAEEELMFLRRELDEEVD